MGLLDQVGSFAQGASNAAASTVSGPVDGISWLLRKAGLSDVIGPAPVGGSDWMAMHGLTAPAPGVAGLAGETAGLLSPMLVSAKASQVARGLLQMADNAAAPIRTGPGASQLGAINVYHGSPHSFDKFDVSKIGTGEGAQAYGHGLYFAENPATATAYAESVKDMGAVKDINAKMSALADVMSAHEIPGSYRQYRTDAGRQAAAQYDELMAQRAAGLAKPGNLYETRLAWPNAAREAADPLGPQHFLQWDKPLSEQPGALQQYLTKRDPEMYAPGGGDYDAAELGQQTYRRLHEMAIRSGPAKPAAIKEQEVVNALRGAGIPGIRYLDQGSRTSGGTANYVVFDDAIPTITGRR